MFSKGSIQTETWVMPCTFYIVWQSCIPSFNRSCFLVTHKDTPTHVLLQYMVLFIVCEQWKGLCSIWIYIPKYVLSTGKSSSEARIFASINPQYDNRLFMELPVQYMKTTSAEHGQNMFFPCSAHVLRLLFSCAELVTQLTIFCHIMG